MRGGERTVGLSSLEPVVSWTSRRRLSDPSKRIEQDVCQIWNTEWREMFGKSCFQAAGRSMKKLR